jgi:hypothetical protein
VIIDTKLKARAEAARKKLDTARDKVSLGLREVEEYLTKLNLGVRARVKMDEGRWLAFGKFNSNWMLILESDRDGGEFVETPLKSTSLECRMDAVTCLARLLEELFVQADRTTAQLQDLSDNVLGPFIESLKKEL